LKEKEMEKEKEKEKEKENFEVANRKWRYFF